MNVFTKQSCFHLSQHCFAGSMGAGSMGAVRTDVEPGDTGPEIREEWL